MELAENPRAVIGGNFPPEEARTRPNKLTEGEALAFAKRAEEAAIILAARFSVAKKRIRGKRQGDKPLILRRALFHYLRGIDMPVKLMAKIFELDRNQPGLDADSMEEWTARNETIEQDMEALTEGLDRLLAVPPKRFISECESEIEADRAAANAIKIAKEAADLLAAAAPKKPAKPPPSAEVARILEAGQRRRRQEEYETEKNCHLAVIRAGAKEGATKDQKRDAKNAALELDKLVRNHKKKSA